MISSVLEEGLTEITKVMDSLSSTHDPVSLFPVISSRFDRRTGEHTVEEQVPCPTPQQTQEIHHQVKIPELLGIPSFPQKLPRKGLSSVIVM
jgi:hypothetical protein